METILSLCTRYKVDMVHAHCVARHALFLFDATQTLHQLSARARQLLEAGALLHNIGLAQDQEYHHIVGRDIVISEPLQDFEAGEQAVLACMVMFHRRTVDALHEPLFVTLNPLQRVEALRLSAIMRVADGLDQSQSQTTVIDEAIVSAQGALLIRTSGMHSHEDAAAAESKADLWRDILGPLRAHGRLTRADISADMPLSLAACRILRYHADQVATDQWDAFDVDEWPAQRVKTMRVAVRRIRQDLRIFADAFKRRPAQLLAKGAQSLASALAAAREMDMLLARAKDFDRDAAHDSERPLDALLTEWKQQRRAAREQLGDYLQTDGHARWHRLLVECTTTDELRRRKQQKVGEPSLVRHSAQLLLWEHLRAVKAYDVLPDAPQPEQLHAARIAVKRLRYFVDAFQNVLAPEQARTILNACVDVQRELGEINDAHATAMYAHAFVADVVEDERKRRKSAPFALQAVIRFASAQQGLVEERTPKWRALLQPIVELN